MNRELAELGLAFDDPVMFEAGLKGVSTEQYMAAVEPTETTELAQEETINKSVPATMGFYVAIALVAAVTLSSLPTFEIRNKNVNLTASSTTEPPKEVRCAISSPKSSIKVGETVTLTADCGAGFVPYWYSTPSTGYWSATGTSVASVDAVTGDITPIHPGRTDVCAKIGCRTIEVYRKNGKLSYRVM